MSTLLDEFDPNEQEDNELESALGRKRPLEADKENALDLEEGELKGVTNDGEEETALKMKERKVRIQLNEAVLTNRDGIIRVYQDFPDTCKFRGKGHEAQVRVYILERIVEAIQGYLSILFSEPCHIQYNLALTTTHLSTTLLSLP